MADDGGGEGAFLGNRGRSPCLDIIGVARSQVAGSGRRQVEAAGTRDQGEREGGGP